MEVWEGFKLWFFELRMNEIFEGYWFCGIVEGWWFMVICLYFLCDCECLYFFLVICLKLELFKNWVVKWDFIEEFCKYFVCGLELLELLELLVVDFLLWLCFNDDLKIVGVVF